MFGRCPYFVIAEIEDKKVVNTESIENTSSKKMQGAGISAAQTVAEKSVDAVITGNVGPRARDVLAQFSIKVYCGAGKIKDVLKDFVDGKLEKIG